MRILKVISLLLDYPDQHLRDGHAELAQAIGSAREISPEQRIALRRLLDELTEDDLMDVQERYTDLFDRGRSLSLLLFEHVHGESRDRGQAMVDLMQMYEAQGLEIDAKELPDYLPLFLEFLSMLPEAEAQDLLGQVAHIVAALKERLRKRRSVYAGAFVALEALAHGKADGKLLRELLDAPEDDPDDLDALDRVWQEEAVTFGGNAGENACGPDRLRTRMRAASRDAATRPTEPPAA